MNMQMQSHTNMQKISYRKLPQRSLAPKKKGAARFLDHRGVLCNERRENSENTPCMHEDRKNGYRSQNGQNQRNRSGTNYDWEQLRDWKEQNGDEGRSALPM